MATQTLDAMPKTMRAVVCHGPEDYRLEEVAGADAGPGRGRHQAGRLRASAPPT